MRRSRQALTLLEGLMSLFLILLLLGLFASLTHEFGAVLKQSESKSNILTTLQVGVRHILADVSQAVPSSILPAAGTSASDLRLARPIEELNSWLPGAPPSAPWTPPASLLRVRYSLSQGTLYREAGSPASVQSLSQGVSEFSVRARPGAPLTLELQLSQRETGRTVTLKAVAMVARF